MQKLDLPAPSAESGGSNGVGEGRIRPRPGPAAEGVRMCHAWIGCASSLPVSCGQPFGVRSWRFPGVYVSDREQPAADDTLLDSLTGWVRALNDVIDTLWTVYVRQTRGVLSREWRAGCVSSDATGDGSIEAVQWQSPRHLVAFTANSSISVSIDPRTGKPHSPIPIYSREGC